MDRTISHFELLEKLGEGGMGVVYKARDTHLSRMVAIKLLPAGVASNPERQLRFAQEGKSASALNHPGVVTVYEIDTVGETTFIAMEYIEGQTLAQRLTHGGLPLVEALRYSIQIAEALAAAHGAGIVHRDLKPANIMITPQGRVKVLDFGIAKLLDNGLAIPGVPSSAKPQSTRTILPQTLEGRVLGTCAYMSPEQAQGLTIDGRSDVFSFGAVLYEMLTGTPAFRGSNSISTLAAILSQEPKPLPEAPNLPSDLVKIVHRCLRKNPDRRFQAIADVRVVLQEVLEDLEAGKSSEPPPATKRANRSPAYVLACAALLCLLGLGAYRLWILKGQTTIPPYFRFTRITSDAGLTTTPALSSDGKLIAYASDRSGRGDLDIWVQQTAGGTPVRVTTDEADDREPSFSPNGSAIAFRSEREKGGIYVVPALGGEPKLVAREGHNPLFSPDGSKIVYWTGAGVNASTPSQIFMVPSAGGTAVPIQSQLKYARHPIWTPDGKSILFWGDDGRAPGWWAIEAPAEDSGPGERRPVRARWHDSRSAENPEFFVTAKYPSGWLGDQVVFSASAGDSTDLWSVPLSQRNWTLSGYPKRLTSGLELASEASTSVGGGVVYASLHQDTNVWAVRADGNSGKAIGELERITNDGSKKNRPVISRDGSKLAYIVQGSPERMMLNMGPIFVKDLRTGKVTSVTSSPSLYPSINADGSRIAFATFFRNEKIQSSRMEVFVAGTNGDVPDKVCEDCGLTPAAWSSDGRKLLYDWGQPQYIGMLDLGTRRRMEMLRSAHRAFTQASFSPDDRWICFLGGVAPERNQVYVAPFVEGKPLPPETSWTAVTDDANFEALPRWSPDGNLIYFISDRDGFRCLWARRVAAKDKKPIGPPFSVLHFHQARQSLTNVGTIGLLGLGVAVDRIVFNLGEVNGNIWMLQTPGAN